MLGIIGVLATSRRSSVDFEHKCCCQHAEKSSRSIQEDS
jgi:hypothetical protein